jgi:hypothetical protein
MKIDISERAFEEARHDEPRSINLHLNAKHRPNE